MNKLYEITYVDGNGYECRQQVAAHTEQKAWLKFITNREYANVLNIRYVGIEQH